VKECVDQGIKRGVVMVAELDGKLVGYVKTYTAPFKSLAHVLGDATIMIDPAFQNRHIGTALIK
jgi:predicted N-acetyltransferase YhbS